MMVPAIARDGFRELPGTWADERPESKTGGTIFNSAVLDVFIGLVFVFLVVSLIASAIAEALASALKLRSTTLLTGIKDLLNDPAGTGLANQLYKHALINPRGNGRQESVGKAANKPAYIDPNSFADALIDGEPR